MKHSLVPPAKILGGTSLFNGGIKSLGSSATPPPTGLLANLISYWKMDEISFVNRVDSIGGNTLLDINNAVAAAAGKINNGVSTNGAPILNLATEIPFAAPFTFLNSSFSVSFWFWIEWVVNDFQFCICIVPNSITNEGLVVAVYDATNQNPNITMYISLFNEFNSELLSVTQYNWHHMVITASGDGLTPTKIYVDGALAISKTSSPSSRNDPEILGVGMRPITQDYGWNGYVDEMGIWQRELSAAEVAQLYNSGNGLPLASF